ncbi:MAG: DNA helicase II [Lysobacterales bacterium]
MTSPLLADLNAAQQAAVAAPPGHYLILAGAGSGKTRVLVHRLAWLIAEQGLWPHSLLAVTFTNKAAGEMRARTEALLQEPGRGLWIGTFHGLAHRLLRLHFEEAGLPREFQVLDADDQQRLVKRIVRESDLDEKRFDPRFGTWQINTWKDQAQRPADIDAREDRLAQIWVDVYRQYQSACQRSGLVDFAELLLRSYELLAEHPALLAHYQRRFAHVLVDEFQDTNQMQYLWLQRLAGEQAQLFAVGDDDQSIYSWRGAQVENMYRFQRDWPEVKVLRLEQNYRSTQRILDAANTLIGNNGDRLGKTLWTERKGGTPIQLYAAYNEQDEARYVIERVRRWRDQGGRLDECAILYRSNALSRVFEQVLVEQKLPYRIYGGQRFFERAEIKDALAWLRLLANPLDDASFERALASPSRGVGERSLERLRALAREQGASLWQAAQHPALAQTLSGKPRNALQGFVELVDRLQQRLAQATLEEQVRSVLEDTGLKDSYAQSDPREAEARLDNLNELVALVGSFRVVEEEEGQTPLTAFLAQAALDAGENQAAPHADAVQLMTLHAAKGLEFPLVFLIGMEEGLFPNQRAMDEGPQQLAEERRLAYVGMTRAEQELVLCYAESRRWRGTAAFNAPSRFLAELPRDAVQEVRPRVQVSRPSALAAAAPLVEPGLPGIKLGANVRHPRFGAGVVVHAYGRGDHARVQVQFDDHGMKELLLAFSKLEVE